MMTRCALGTLLAFPAGLNLSLLARISRWDRAAECANRSLRDEYSAVVIPGVTSLCAVNVSGCVEG